ncbi:PA2778 family cysteine peptidase [Halopseudomonas oceani]|uniref:PA2778 family cysteine peptidase n=1 Tax=Halopseudomonas oceani TaxID=1708783 RepID=UPI002AA77614|nr:PA2778 family cysteine peptidase [Halopseudomonas oceani]
MYKAIRLALALGLTALLSACAGLAPIQQQSIPDDLPPNRLLTNLPFHAQDEYQCGPAALSMLLGQRNINISPEQLKDRVYLPERKGSLQVEMVAAARQQGLLVYPLAPELKAILREIDAGNAVLVMQNLAFNWYPQWHYAVVVGYDLNTRELILHSGLNARQREPFGLFLRTWQRADNWAVVAMPAGKLPATAEPLPYLKAAADLEQVGQTASAEAAYQAASEHWTDQPAALLGQGNIAWNSGRQSEAVDHFSELVRRFPDYPAGWNNLATAMEEMGCREAAEQVRSCATEQQVNHSKVSTEADCLIPVCR